MSGEGLFVKLTTVDGWHTLAMPENLMLYGKYVWNATKLCVRAFELRYIFHRCFFRRTHEEFADDPTMHRAIMQDEQTTMRFRTEISERSLIEMTTKIPVIEPNSPVPPSLEGQI